MEPEIIEPGELIMIAILLIIGIAAVIIALLLDQKLRRFQERTIFYSQAAIARAVRENRIPQQLRARLEKNLVGCEFVELR